MANRNNKRRNTSQSKEVYSKKKTASQFREAYKEAFGIEPINVHGLQNLRSIYYRMQLEKIALSILDIEYNTEAYNWDIDYMREGILINGLLTFTETDEGVLLPLKCQATGVNVFNRSTQVIVANPVVGSFTRTIGEDCEIVYLQQKQGSRFRNINSILDVYSQKLANCDCGIDVNIFNSRTPLIFQAPNQTVADSYKAMYDEISEGNPAVFIDEELGNLLQGKENSNLYQLKAKEYYIANDMQLEKHEVMNEFLTGVGINNANMNKREREVVDEVNANNMAIRANIKLYKENIDTCVDKVNKRYPDAQLRITFPYYEESKKQENAKVEEGGDSNEPS